MKYTCPLCGQPVSTSLYQKITGIWQERQKALQKIKEQRARLLKNINGERKKLRKQAADFRKRKTRLVKQEVQKQTRRLEFKIRTLRRREKQVENRTREKIRIATERAHRETDRLAAAGSIPTRKTFALPLETSSRKKEHGPRSGPNESMRE